MYILASLDSLRYQHQIDDTEIKIRSVVRIKMTGGMGLHVDTTAQFSS